jgi:hypothetical protein
MIRIFALIAFLIPAAVMAQDAEPPMTLPRMAEIVLALDPDAQVVGNGFEFSIDDIPVLIITDVGANRMRAMVPIRSAEGMDLEELQRVMQANFDSALDARYAVAQGRLWGVFLHPFAQLERDQLISGVAQTVNVAKTYGTLYTSGAAQFGAGDSGNLQRQLIEELLDRGQDI